MTRPSVFDAVLSEQVLCVSRGDLRSLTKGSCGLELLCA